MGAVYEARQVKLDRRVALKVLPPQISRDPSFTERFVREARALAKLSHPNIVGIHDFGEAGGYCYFVMEYVDGFNLRQWFAARPVQHPSALEIIPQICDGLQYARESGVVHRDIKPENVLLTSKGQVKIADFGLAKLLTRTPVDLPLTRTHQVMGTPHYMAPEQMERPHAVDHRADIFAVGVLCYEMLTGELPLGRFAAPSQKVPVHPQLDGVVLRALEKEPERRYPQIHDLKRNLLACAAVPPPPVVDSAEFQQEVEQELLRLKVRGPTIALIATAVLGFLQWLTVAVGIYIATIDDITTNQRNLNSLLLQTSGPPNDPDATAQYQYKQYQYTIESVRRNLDNYRQHYDNLVRISLLVSPLVIGAAGLLVIGAGRMMRFESYTFVQFCSAWAMIPWSAAFLIGVVAGARALAVLRQPEIKLAFVHNVVRRRLGIAGPGPAVPTPAPANPPGPVPTGFVRRKLRSIWQAARTLFFYSRPDAER
jgi:serine/threonine protein kinase